MLDHATEAECMMFNMMSPDSHYHMLSENLLSSVKKKPSMPVGNLPLLLFSGNGNQAARCWAVSTGGCRALMLLSSSLLLPVWSDSSLLELILGLWLFLLTHRSRYWYCCWVVALLMTQSSSPSVSGCAPGISVLFRWSWETEQTLQLRV